MDSRDFLQTSIYAVLLSIFIYIVLFMMKRMIRISEDELTDYIFIGCIISVFILLYAWMNAVMPFRERK